ncbi:hypothetical protein CLF_110121 [Clonorchis sinensis]|uniref:Uncharacterized protein n=1 Tax=Clonorchis sinensis TaxID=79923 RepID=G7YT68_CLOSI|nr:hypothetical protein CLF_110121 [Clonorchis sinensis]
MSFSLHLEKSAQKAFAVLRMIRRTFSRITRTDFQMPYGAYVRPLFEYANPIIYSGRTKDVIIIERVQRAATKMVAGPTSVDYETRLAVLDPFALEYRRFRGDIILTPCLNINNNNAYSQLVGGMPSGIRLQSEYTHDCRIPMEWSVLSVISVLKYTRVSCENDHNINLVVVVSKLRTVTALHRFIDYRERRIRIEYVDDFATLGSDPSKMQTIANNRMLWCALFISKV